MEILNQLIITKDNFLVSFDIKSLVIRVTRHDTLDTIWDHLTTANFPQDLSILTEYCVNYLHGPGKILPTSLRHHSGVHT
jgi:hypothetical protein